MPAVLKELAEQTPDLDVLVVSDGSTDRTAEVARGAGVYVAVLPFNVGIGGALRTGFSFAVRQGYDRAAQFDADGQHDPLALGVAPRRYRRRRRHGDRVAVRGGRRRHLRGQRRAAPGDEVPAVDRAGAGAPALHRHQLGLPRLLAPDARVLRRQLPGRVHGLGRSAGAGVQRRLPRRGGRCEHARSHRRRAVHAAPAARLLLRAAGDRPARVDHQPWPTGPAHTPPATTIRTDQPP